MVAEQSITNQFNGIDHIQRPGEVLFAEVGDGPIRGIYRQAGTFGGDFLVASALEWYRVTAGGVETLLGAITGTDRTSTAATQTRAITVAGGLAYSTNGTTVAPVVMPDARPVGSVAQLNGYFILPEFGSARFYWIEPGQVNPDGLSFATTESSPGDIIKVERVGDELWFLKEEGIEVWAPTGDADLPFQRIPGRNYDRGCRARDAVCRFDNSLGWVGNDGVVYRGDTSPVRFSDNSIEEQIRKADRSTLRAWSYAVDGHTMYVLTMDTGTFAYDVSTQAWSEFQSYDRQVWRCHVGDYGDDFVVAGDDAEGRLYRLDPDVANDAGTPMLRLVTGGLTVVGKAKRCDSLQLYAVTGTIEDPNLFPKARIRWSDDLQNYGNWVDVLLKKQGNFGDIVRINRLGAMRYPGRLFEVSVTDDVIVTISALSYGEPSR